MSELEGALKRTVGEVEVVKGQVERILTALLASREIVRERERPSISTSHSYVFLFQRISFHSYPKE